MENANFYACKYSENRENTGLKNSDTNKLCLKALFRWSIPADVRAEVSTYKSSKACIMSLKAVMESSCLSHTLCILVWFIFDKFIQLPQVASYLQNCSLRANKHIAKIFKGSDRENHQNIQAFKVAASIWWVMNRLLSVSLL